MLPWTVVRYNEDGHPSHPDEDLPPDGADVEMWRPGPDAAWYFGRGICRRTLIDGEHVSAEIGRTTHQGIQYPPDDMPLSVRPGGVVWRLM